MPIFRVYETLHSKQLGVFPTLSQAQAEVYKADGQQVKWCNTSGHYSCVGLARMKEDKNHFYQIYKEGV